MKHGFLALFVAATLACFAGDLPERCVLSMSVPTYPPVAEQARIEGIVKIRIFVNENGEVTDATASSGHEILKHAAIENVRTWRFTPFSGAKPQELFITYLYSIEGQEVAHPPKCAKVRLDLPTRIEVTAPPLAIETNTSR